MALGNTGEIDGAVRFSSSWNSGFDYNTNSNRTIPSNQYDFVGVALHELTHALGRIAGLTFG